MAGNGEHLRLLRLFDLARHRGDEPSEKEHGHLRECEECQRTLEVFTRQFSTPSSKPEDEG